MTTCEPQVVATLEQTIAQRIGQPRYRLWFDGKTKFNWDDRQLVVGVPNRFYQEWLEKTFAHAVRTAADMVLGQPMQVRFAIDPQLYQSSRIAQIEEPDRGSNGTSEEQARALPPPRESASQERPAKATKRIRRWRRLEDFVVGPCNRLAHAAALSVVESPGFAANPLVLYGPIGTGKTHLLEGIYAGLRKGRPDYRVCYVTSEDFTNRFVQAMRKNQLGTFRKQFRGCDALLVDDLHFLAGKRATQEEFLHTFDALHADGRQMVLTCDCHPRLADDFAPELTDRLLGGAVWGLTPPDAETRRDILRAKVGQARGEPPGEEVLAFIAEQLRGNVRELEGALHSVRHYAKVTGRRIDVPLTREALADLLRHSLRMVKLPDIDGAVCTVLRLETGALQAKGRSWAASHPRMVAMYLARKHTGASYSDIGGHFGGRNHSTAVAAEKKVRQWLRDDAELALGERRFRVREIVERVERELAR